MREDAKKKAVHLSLDRPPAAKANESPEFVLDMVARDFGNS